VSTTWPGRLTILNKSRSADSLATAATTAGFEMKFWPDQDTGSLHHTLKTNTRSRTLIKALRG